MHSTTLFLKKKTMDKSTIRHIDVILYHHPCTDGAASAWVLSRYCKDLGLAQPSCFGVFAGGLGPEDARVIGKHVVAVDVLPRNHAAIAAVAASFVVLDHHEGNAEALAAVPYGVYAASGLSGVGMAWQFVHGTSLPLPLALACVQDRDLNAFSSEFTRYASVAIQALIDLHDLTLFFQSMDEINNSLIVLAEYYDFGKRYSAMVAQRARTMVASATPKTVEFQDRTLTCLVFNALMDMITPLGDAGLAMPGIDFVCVWRREDSGNPAAPFTVSLRSSHASVDTIPLAREFGAVYGLGPGGGHRNASGFSTRDIPENIFKPVR
jgi:hypothetical protein